MLNDFIFVLLASGIYKSSPDAVFIIYVKMFISNIINVFACLLDQTRKYQRQKMKT